MAGRVNPPNVAFGEQFEAAFQKLVASGRIEGADLNFISNGMRILLMLGAQTGLQVAPGLFVHRRPQLGNVPALRFAFTVDGSNIVLRAVDFAD